jgi:O-antigen/teichoic acid export membrane protein
MLMAVAKLGSTTLVGEFSLALAIVTPVVILSQMQLRQVFVTDTGRRAPFGAFFRVRALAGAVAVAGAIGAVAVLGHSLRFILLTALLGLARYADSQSDIVYAGLQRHERLHLAAVSLMVRGLLGLGVITVILWLTGSLIAATGVLALTWIGVFAILDVPLLWRVVGGNALRWQWEGSAVRALISTSAPLTIAAGLVALSSSIPRYVLNYYQGKPAVALFAVAMTPISLMGLFTGALAQATIARAADYLQNGRLREFEALARKITWVNILIGLALMVILAIAARTLIRIFFTQEYESAAPIMLVLGAGVALNGMAAFGSTVLSAGRRFSLQLAIVLVGSVVQIVGCLLWVPRSGPLGAAWAELARYAVSTVLLIFVGRNVYRAFQRTSLDPQLNPLPRVDRGYSSGHM